MSIESLELDRGPLLGRVTETDASRAVVELSDPSLLRRVTVSDLVSLPAREPREHLIGLVETVSRQAGRDASVNGAGGAPRAGGGVRAMLIGTLVHGSGGDVFKRGASCFPQVGSKCRLIEPAVPAGRGRDRRRPRPGCRRLEPPSDRTTLS